MVYKLVSPKNIGKKTFHGTKRFIAFQTLAKDKEAFDITQRE
jgi:hypothetical protein